MNALARIARPVALALALFLPAGVASAQQNNGEPPAEEGTGQGPVPGYVAVGLLGGLCMFVLCKSARR